MAFWNQEPASAQNHGEPVFYGFLAVGFASLLGGIAMFAYVVPKDMDPGDVPRDVGVVFTEVYTQQLTFHNDAKRYAASLGEVNVDRDTCDRYHCRLTTQPDGEHYIFRLSKNGHTWAVQPPSPVPKLVM